MWRLFGALPDGVGEALNRARSAYFLAGYACAGRLGQTWSLAASAFANPSARSRTRRTQNRESSTATRILRRYRSVLPRVYRTPDFFRRSTKAALAPNAEEERFGRRTPLDCEAATGVCDD